MKNYKDLKSDQLQARKNRDTKKATFLSTLIGEVELELKPKARSAEDIRLNKPLPKPKPTDEVLVKTATKFKKGIEEMMKQTLSDNNTENELVWINEYVPVLLDEDEIRSIVGMLVLEFGKNMRDIMPKLKVIDGMDMKLASKIIKGLQ